MMKLTQGWQNRLKESTKEKPNQIVKVFLVSLIDLIFNWMFFFNLHKIMTNAR